jgi:proteasome lid subunit RPN8/RPN11
LIVVTVASVWKIKMGTVEAVLEAARNTFPNEFFCYLGGDKKKKTVDEIVMIPTVFGRSHAIVSDWLRPFDRKIVGSAQSHPGQSARPSPADLDGFARQGEIHLIVALPFTMEKARAFDSTGKEIGFEVVG